MAIITAVAVGVAARLPPIIHSVEIDIELEGSPLPSTLWRRRTPWGLLHSSGSIVDITVHRHVPWSVVGVEESWVDSLIDFENVAILLQGFHVEDSQVSAWYEMLSHSRFVGESNMAKE